MIVFQFRVADAYLNDDHAPDGLGTFGHELVVEADDCGGVSFELDGNGIIGLTVEQLLALSRAVLEQSATLALSTPAPASAPA